VIDRSNRIFAGITILQYAVWALDIEMCNLIISYLDPRQKGIQLNVWLCEPERYSVYGAQYDMMPLITKTQMYIDNYAKWSDDECCQYWQKEVGTEQQKCPAWLIYAWSEEGKDAAWVKKDFSRGFKREYDKHRVEWWFTGKYNNGVGVGSTYAVLRGNLPCITSVERKPDNWIFDGGKLAIWGDNSNHKELKASRQEAIQLIFSDSGAYADEEIFLRKLLFDSCKVKFLDSNSDSDSDTDIKILSNHGKSL
jgi:hypothetical protein